MVFTITCNHGAGAPPLNKVISNEGKQMNKVAKVSIAAAMVLGVVAGTGAVAAPAQAAQNITLTFRDWGDMGFKDLFAQYHKLHPNITIVEKSSEYNAHHQGLLTALASGKGNDINGIEGSWMPYFVQYPSKFLDLRKYGGSKLAKNYLSWRWNPAVAKDGTILGLPTDVGGMAVAYRTDLFKAAGLPSDPAGVSALWAKTGWDGYVAVAKQYTDKTGKKFADSTQGIFSGIVAQNPTQYYDNKGNLIYASNKLVKAAWDTTVAVAPYSGSAAVFSTEWNAAIANGDAASVLAPAWMLTMIKGIAPKTSGDWNVATVPGGGGNWGGSWVTVSKSTAHPAEAAAFVEWLLAPAQQKTIFLTKGNLPSAVAALNDPAVTGYKDAFFQDAPVGKIYGSSAASLKPAILGPKSASIGTSFQNAAATVAQGKASGAAAWSNAIAEIQKNVGPSK
jgi:cellobiose transport system substrate-binding protein